MNECTNTTAGHMGRRKYKGPAGQWPLRQSLQPPSFLQSAQSANFSFMMRVPVAPEPLLMLATFNGEFIRTVVPEGSVQHNYIPEEVDLCV